MNDRKFRVEFLEDAKIFLDQLDERARAKIIYNIWKSRSLTDKNLFKKLQDNIWEFRTKFMAAYLFTSEKKSKTFWHTFDLPPIQGMRKR